MMRARRADSIANYVGGAGVVYAIRTCFDFKVGRFFGERFAAEVAEAV